MSYSCIQADFEHPPRFKGSIGVNLGFSHHHPGNNIFYSPPSTTPLIRDNFEIISVVPFGWKLKPVVQQTYITNINPSYHDIVRRDDYPQPHQHADLTILPLKVLKSTQLLLRQFYSHLQLPRSPTPRQQSAPILIIRKMSRILPTLTPVWHNFH